MASKSSKTENPQPKAKKKLGIEFAPVNLPWERRFQTFCVLCWTILFFVITIGTYPLIFYLLFFSNNKAISATIIIPYLTWIWIIDRETPNRDSRTSNWARNWWVWKGYNEYFPIKLIKTCDLDPKRNYLLGSHPHGVLCSGAFGVFGTGYHKLEKVFPGLRFHLLTLELNFKWPIARDIFLALGGCAASRKGMNYLLSKKEGGIAAVLVPGGAPESLESHPGTNVIHLKNRKGFVKVAIQNGAWLVPVITFGETEVYYQEPNPKGSRWRNMQETFMKKTTVAPLAIRGRGIFQYTFGYLPYRRPLTVVVGAPIEVEKVENPSNEMISEIHQKYVDALVELFNQNKEKYAIDPSHEITIV